ncbi:MAG TPA: serine hydrolase [Longimicrobiaceae bacterium]
MAGTAGRVRVRAPWFILAVGAPLALGACVPSRPPPPPAPMRLPEAAVLVPAAPEAVGLAAGLPARLDSIARAAVADRAASAVAVSAGRWGRLVHQRGYGATDWAPGAPPAGDSTIFDLASLTKVVATTTAAMILEEEGRLQLDRPVAYYVPELTDTLKAGITVRQILTHRGGFEAFAPLYQNTRGQAEYLRKINERPLKHAPGTETVYSDWDLILMQRVIEHISGQTLDQFADARIFRPLGMHDTGFRPAAALRPRIAATEVDRSRGGLIQGEVHDPNAWAIGGVAGHAGLFSSARDLAVFAQMLLNNGEYGGVRILRPETVARWTAPQFAGSSRALGWDTPSGRSSAGRFFGPRSYGHTGYTGTSLWIDPERGVFVVILTNRVNPTAENQKHVPLRRTVADAVMEAVLDAPLTNWEARRGG